MIVIALLSNCYCAVGTYHATLLSGNTVCRVESTHDERHVTKKARLAFPANPIPNSSSVNPHQSDSLACITRIPYSADLGEHLREHSVTNSRPVWLRLEDGKQELFAAWPEQVIRIVRGALTLDGKTEARPIAGGKKALWPLLRETLPPNAPNISCPFKGGWIGVLGYDLALPDATDSPRLLFPDALLGDYRRFVFIDHEQQMAELVTLSGYTGPLDDPLVSSKSCEPDHYLQPFKLTHPFEAITSAARYKADFGRIQSLLQAGDCYQVNYAQAFKARCQGSGAAAMKRLLALTRAPNAAWMLAPEGEVLSLSPELFLSIQDGKVVTKPIKGTAPRDANPEVDLRNRDELEGSTKNRAENLMIVDLLRHDLSRHAETGSVRVEKLFAIEALPQVYHLVSTVTARIAEGADAIDVIRDCFPGGSITGAPKKRAMEIIAELEPTPRSVYCGSIGFIGTNGDAELNIAIRTLLRIDADLYAWAGGGIVADSICEKEYQECFDKMGALMRALETGD